MDTENSKGNIVVQTKHGPGIFSLAIALFQPGTQNYVELACKPIRFGSYEIIALRAYITGAENRSPHPRTKKKFWRLTGKIDKALAINTSENRAWYSLNELCPWVGPNRQKLFPPNFTWIYEIDSRKGQIVLTHDESEGNTE